MILTMQRNPDALGMAVPIGRRIGEAGKRTWFVLIIAASMALAGVYFYQINAAATKTFALREQEKRLEHLRETVSSLETQAAKEQAMVTMEERIKGVGFVPNEHVEYLSVEN